MKKILSIFTASLLAFTLTGIKENKVEVNAATSNTISYTADFSNGLPSDWTLYSKCGVSSASNAKSDNGVTITGGDVSASYYYGTLYQIDCGSDSVGDFELSFTYRWTAYANTSRWIGVLYHTQLTNDKLSGYMMNYRVQGKSAQSSVSNTPSFNDNGVVENTGIPMTDKEFHTLSISCSSGHVTHYMDSQKIMEYDTETYSSYLGKDQTSGGFALIVNNSTIEVKSLTITGTVGSQNQSELDTSVTDVYNPGLSTYTDVSVNTFVENEEQLKALSATETPANAILYINKDMEVTDEDGNSFNISLKEAYDTYLKDKIIPVVYIKDDDTATNLITYLKSTLNIVDIAVASDNPDLLLKVRKGRTSIRGILDWSKNTYSEEDWGKIVADTNKAYCNIALLNKATATRKAINYIQARFKTVWVNNTEYSGLNVVSEVANGAYGVVTPNVSQAFTDLRCLDNTEASDRNFTRMPYNIAHRGACLTNYENSMEAFIEAYNAGATLLELDIQITKDNKLAVMHDDTIDRTTNGTGSVSSYTAEQLKQYQIIKNYSGSTLGGAVSIPMYDEVLEYFKDKDIVIITEIKTSNSYAVDVLKQYLDQYDMYDQVTVISFYEAQLSRTRDLIPEIPTANLNGIKSDVMGSSTLPRLGSLNCGIDYSYGYVDGTTGAKYLTRLAMRGFSSWIWTYQTKSDVLDAINAKVLGITNNSGQSIPTLYKDVEYSGKYVIAVDGSFIEAYTYVDGIQYNREVVTDTLTASPLYIEDHGTYAYAVYCVYTTYKDSDSRVTYKFEFLTDVIKIIMEDAYIAPSTMNAIAAKSVSELDEEEKELLLKIPDAILLLDEEDQASVDYDKITQMIEELTGTKPDPLPSEETSEVPSETPSEDVSEPTSEEPAPTPSKKGCGGVAAGSVFGLLAIAGALILSKKRK